jgi:transcriptional regulator with XRE-family HTH domain
LDTFAEKVGVTEMAFYNYYTGRNNASLGTFQKILDVLNIQMNDLVEQEELFTEKEEPKTEEPKKDIRIVKIISAIDTLIEALDDIRCELCGAE